MTGAVVDVHGAEALRRFGLSNQVPMQPVFYTSGPSRRFKLGETEVVLKHVAPRKLALAGWPAGLALRALWYLGDERVTPDVIQTIMQKLVTGNGMSSVLAFGAVAVVVLQVPIRAPLEWYSDGKKKRKSSIHPSSGPVGVRSGDDDE